MSVILETYKVKKNVLNFEHPKTYLILSLGISLFGFILRGLNKYINLDFLSIFSNSLIITSAFVLIFSSIALIFFYKDYSLSNKGFIKITNDNIIIDEKIYVQLGSLIDFSIHIIDFKGEIDYIHGDIDGYLELGVDNEIYIKSLDFELKRNFQLNNKKEQKKVRYFISNLIVNYKLTNVPANKLVKVFDNDFRKTKEARDFIAQKIKERKLNLTEGLLMMNYSSDEEANELRKEYNL